MRSFRRYNEVISKLGHALKLVITFALTLTAISATHAADPPSCVPDFKTLSPAPVDPSQALDRLVTLETDISNAETTVRNRISSLKLSSKEAFRLTNEKHLEITEIQANYEALTDDLLSETPARFADFESRFQSIKSRLEHALSFNELKRTLTAPTNGPRFQELIESPQLLEVAAHYDVPQAAAVAGSASAKKLSVSFTREVLDYFKADLERGSRFLRAIQKGYIGTGSGSGIVRITDHHEALVEIKVIGGKEGHQRLIGCRRADGYIEILKVYEKRNEGSGGSLKHFAELCD